MKRIILGLSVFLLLTQSLIAMTDEEWDKRISEETIEVWKQIWRCDKAVQNHMYTANVNICLKAIKLKKQNGVEESDFDAIYEYTAILYSESAGDKLKAYEYFMKAARLGNTNAQKNLDIMCKQSPWACK